ncbi:TetR/AcrR family transcriptional regulator [Coriobacteriia bacterium Es71-Z0120]|uniref:TetR/AcrR family transcriptional regulator n=1 Tax=Parvivirga hydrogeniphila TaxID=2939460 RepID=UPI0022609C7D|nr:TetR/AcrR family transcriptional regulator [Parvivirga hydrogeniphila]MCL4078448.1 TetR/AcrR family transcriptional regulator [Parvivirga hydrogeniphila]
MASAEPHGSSDSARDRILASAGALFGQRGFDAVSVADIAQASGTSTSLIYYHFADKQSLFETAVLEAADLMEAVASDALAEPGSPAERLIAFARAYSELLGSHPDTMRVLILSVASLEGRLPQQVLERASAIVDALASAIADGIAAGAFRPVDPRQAAAAFFAMTNAPITARALSVVGGFAESLPADVGERMADLFLRGIRA